MPAVRSSPGRSATVTQSSLPSKRSPRPKRPAVRTGPDSRPALRWPDASAVLAPPASSKPQAPTSLARGRGGPSGSDGKTLGVGVGPAVSVGVARSEEHMSELQSLAYLVCRLLLEKKKHN